MRISLISGPRKKIQMRFFPESICRACNKRDQVQRVPGSNNIVAQTRYPTDLSYLRFKNLTVGYTIPSVLSQKANIQKVRVYFSAQNLAEWTKQDLPVDPEINETEAQWGTTFPYTRTDLIWFNKLIFDNNLQD
jgi:hypothetical protein